MPKLERGDQRIIDLNIDGNLPQHLNLTELTRSEDPRAMKIAQNDFVAETATIWQIGGQRILGGVLVNMGIPDGDPFDAALSAIELDEPALDVLRILRETMGGTVADLVKSDLDKAFSEGIGIATDMLGAVPVAGWIAKGLITAGTAIYRLVKLVQQGQEPPQETHPRATFSPGLDSSMAQGVIGKTRHSLDWDALFSPPGVGSTHAYLPGVGFQRLDRGIRMRIAGMNEAYSDGWTGYIPGSNMVTAQFEIIPQEQGSANLQVYDTGRLFPTVSNMATMAWGVVTKNSPQMYCVNTDNLISRWTSYLGQIRDAIQETGRLTKEQKRAVVRKLKPVYGWAPFNSKTAVGDWDKYMLNDTVPIRALKTLRARQLGYLDTTTIAYIDATFEAIRKDAELRSKYERNLSLLLKHPARCKLDMKNIRDPDYEKALYNSGVGTPRCMQLGLAAGPFGKKAAVPAFPKNPAGEDSSGAKGGGGLAIAALAAIALLAGRR